MKPSDRGPFPRQHGPGLIAGPHLRVLPSPTPSARISSLIEPTVLGAAETVCAVAIGCHSTSECAVPLPGRGTALADGLAGQVDPGQSAVTVDDHVARRRQTSACRWVFARTKIPRIPRMRSTRDL